MRFSPHTIKSFLQWLAIACILTGMLCSFAAMSIGMMALVLFSFLNDDPLTYSAKSLKQAAAVSLLSETFSVSYVKSVVKKFFVRKDLVAITLIFWIVLISGINSQDMNAWFNALLMKLPFLMLPFSFAALQPFNRKFLWSIFCLLIAALFISSVVVVANYLINYDAVNESILKGTPIWTPMQNHVRFSLLIALCSVLCFVFGMHNFFQLNKMMRILLVCIGGVFVAVLLVISVRSGLIAVFFSLAYLFVIWIIKYRMWFWGLVLLSLSVVALFTGIKTIPSLQNKISYVKWSWQQYKHNDHTYYSDVSRLLNIKAGVSLVKNNVWCGVGYGDVQAECEEYFAFHYPDVEKKFAKKPHNQFLYTQLAGGVVVLILFMIAVFFPIIYKKAYRHHVFMAVQIILLSSFMFDYTLETQTGVVLYLVPIVLLLHHIHRPCQTTNE